MKKIISVVMIALLCISFTGCAKTYHGTDELIEKARKEIPIADADTIDMEYAGMCGKGDKAKQSFVQGYYYQRNALRWLGRQSCKRGYERTQWQRLMRHWPNCKSLHFGLSFI